MKVTRLILVALLLMNFPMQLRAETDPLQNFSVGGVAGAKKLHASLAGTIWIYHYEGSDYTLAFGKSGEIEILKEWSDVKWRIASPSEVILDRPNGQMILLRFNDNVTGFRCKDWMGRPATGTKTGKTRG